MRPTALFLIMALAPVRAGAYDGPRKVTWRGLLDLRAVRTSPNVSALRGGPGKLRFGGRDRDRNGTGDGNATTFAAPRLTGALTVDLGGATQFQFSAETDADSESAGTIGVLEAVVVSTRDLSFLRGRARAGTFFPPLAGNNRADWDGAPTLTPSAAATWTAEELRMIGAEGALSAALGPVDAELTLGVFSGADQAGRILMVRGWTLHDRTSRVQGNLILPGGTTYRPFAELDGRPGGYAKLAAGWGEHVRATAGFWDNGGRGGEAGTLPVPPAWSTHVLDFTASAAAYGFKVEGQALRGDTAAAAVPRTGFGASSLTASYRAGAWTAAVRADKFHAGGSAERGSAWTTALHWDPSPRRRLSLDYARVSAVGSPAAGRRAAVDQLLTANVRVRF